MLRNSAKLILAKSSFTDSSEGEEVAAVRFDTTDVALATLTQFGWSDNSEVWFASSSFETNVRFESGKDNASWLVRFESIGKVAEGRFKEVVVVELSNHDPDQW